MNDINDFSNSAFSRLIQKACSGDPKAWDTLRDRILIPLLQLTPIKFKYLYPERLGGTTQADVEAYLNYFQDWLANKQNRADLCRYMQGQLKKKNCPLWRFLLERLLDNLFLDWHWQRKSDSHLITLIILGHKKEVVAYLRTNFSTLNENDFEEIFSVLLKSVRDRREQKPIHPLRFWPYLTKAAFRTAKGYQKNKSKWVDSPPDITATWSDPLEQAHVVWSLQQLSIVCSRIVLFWLQEGLPDDDWVGDQTSNLPRRSEVQMFYERVLRMSKPAFYKKKDACLENFNKFLEM